VANGVILTCCSAQAALTVHDHLRTFDDLKRYIGVRYRVGEVGGRKHESLEFAHVAMSAHLDVIREEITSIRWSVGKNSIFNRIHSRYMCERDGTHICFDFSEAPDRQKLYTIPLFKAGILCMSALRKPGSRSMGTMIMPLILF